jgi:hypothetical protein
MIRVFFVICNSENVFLHLLHYAVNQESAKSCCCESSGFEIPEEIVSESELTFPDSAIQVEQCEEFECTGWTGGVNYVPSDTDTDTDDDWKDTDLDLDLDGHSENTCRKHSHQYQSTPSENGSIG